MVNLTTGSCSLCKVSADDEDGLCSACRAEAACAELTENIGNVLEIFLDARYSPQDGPAYYRKSPACYQDARELTEIAADCEQMAEGIERLLELALKNGSDGRRTMRDLYGCGCDYRGWHARLEWWEDEK